MERSADKKVRTTEWEDVQYKYGNRVGKYETHELEILAQKVADKTEDAALRVYSANEEKVEDKLARGGYEFAEGDAENVENIIDSDNEDDALALIRQKRMMELRKQKANECFGVLRHIPGSDYVAEVTEASKKNWVVALLVRPANDDCETLLNIMRVEAQRFRGIKFVSMISTEAIPNFPDRHVPCVLMYYEGTMKAQLTTLDPWKEGRTIDIHTVESVLKKYNVLPKDESEDD